MGEYSPRNEDEVRSPTTRRPRALSARASAEIPSRIAASTSHVSQVPKIAIVGSGGGFSAMVGLTGAFRALVDTGVFDCATYLSTLSGSSWCALRCILDLHT